MREQAKGARELHALRGQLIGGAGRSVDVGPRQQNRVAFESLEALRQDVRSDPRDLLQQLVEPPRTREQGLYDEQSPPIPDASQSVGEWGGCILFELLAHADARSSAEIPYDGFLFAHRQTVSGRIDTD